MVPEKEIVGGVIVGLTTDMAEEKKEPEPVKEEKPKKTVKK